jgi:hypothetical protein
MDVVFVFILTILVATTVSVVRAISRLRGDE